MVIIRLWGGLGNQMFQYACGYAIAMNNNTELLLDTRFYNSDFLKKNPRFSKQQLNILKFPIQFRRQVNMNGEYKKVCFLQNKILNRLIRLPKRFSVNHVDGMRYEKETRLAYLPYIASIKSKNVYLDGYWQSEEYFAPYKKEIRSQFLNKSQVALLYVQEQKLTDENTVAIHMRLGDYAKSKKGSKRYNYILNPQYYLNAVEEMKQRLSAPRFFVFSNDIQKAKSILGCNGFCYVNCDRSMTDIEEFEIMSLCSNHIISNSTFSWWAAWLSERRGINMAPDIFFGNENIIPESWIKIKTNNQE